MAGLPEVDDINSFNQILSDKCMKSISEEVHYQTKMPLKEIFHSMKLRPLPEAWEWGKWEDGKVNSYQCAQYDGHSYSVPEKYLGSELKIWVTSSKIKIYVDQELVAAHERSFVKGEKSLKLDHYLDQLERKPRAFNFAKVVQQEVWEDTLKEIRDRLRNRMDASNADMELVKILKLKRQCSSHDYDTAIRLALAYGGITASAIKMLIDQLQLSQLQSTMPIAELPSRCQIDLRGEYCLDQYQQLCRKEVLS
jgi:hypothetical protein